ncbi:hypothetical protein N5T77_10195 [Aliarcobacter cryaerophilus]|uniref:coiled-coil domain-containing protein n=1 Tax=Aliarcobacter cryaerophilus TaxID=28198 RepID=UPI0021B54F79|nr:hypothetical protein [Aliarcobacter cryaerophilus]MCT7525419.1 hypothetical protein [Aliarcobacter cryaerophilus]
MKNFISVNNKVASKSALLSIFKHNVQRLQRGNKIDYLLSEKDSLGNRSFFFEFDKTLKMTKQKMLKEEDYFLVCNNLEKLESVRLEKLQDRENRGDYLKNHLVEMCVSLSAEQVEEYLSEGKDLSKGIQAFIKNLKEKYNIKTLMYSEHFDEGYLENGVVNLNYHYHLVGYNYDLENMKAINSTFRKQDFRDLQDLASISFKSVNLNFERGLSKNITKKEHLERNDFIIEKQQKTIKELYTNANKIKNEFKDLRKNFERGSEEYTNLTNIIKNLQNEEQELRGKKEILLQDRKEQRALISEFAKNFIIENTILKNDKRIIKDNQQFFKKMVLEFEKFSKLDIKNLDYQNIKKFQASILVEAKKKQNENFELKQKIEKLEVENNNLKKDISKKDLEKNDLEHENNTLKTKVNNFRDFVVEKNLKEDYKKFKDRNNEVIQASKNRCLGF